MTRKKVAPDPRRLPADESSTDFELDAALGETLWSAFVLLDAAAEMAGARRAKLRREVERARELVRCVVPNARPLTKPGPNRVKAVRSLVRCAAHALEVVRARRGTSSALAEWLARWAREGCGLAAPGPTDMRAIGRALEGAGDEESVARAVLVACGVDGTVAKNAVRAAGTQ